MEIISKSYLLLLDDDNHVSIKYSKMPMLLREQLDYLDKVFSQKIEISEKYEQYLDKISKQIHRAYANFMSRDIDKEYYDEFVGYLNVDQKYEFPFYNKNVFILSSKDLFKIPFERLYAIPSNGVRFEFINKEHCIDYIDMKENDEYINFNIYIINNGGLSTSRMILSELVDNGNIEIGVYDDNVFTRRTSITKKMFKISFFINKSELKEAITVDKKIETLRCIGYLPNPENFSRDFFDKMRFVAFGCLYSAYYNPSMFNEEVKLYNKSHYKRNGYSRTSSYRVEHLMKLPVGSQASPEAITYGKKRGFDNIPEGYTFVRESNLEKKDEFHKKIMKIKK